MSSLERSTHCRGGIARNVILAMVLAMAFAASACTVRPLYGDISSSVDGGSTARLASISVKQVSTRYAQEVRNHLIFGLNGGAGEPSSPQYVLDLGVISYVRSSASVQVVLENEPTAGAVVMTSVYKLIDAETGDVVASGKRSATASFDKPRQEFAALRAERDAENRAARELAEFVKLAVLQDLENLPSS